MSSFAMVGVAPAQDAQLSLHAPQPALQEIFEATICSSHAREGRLLARWVAELSTRGDGAPPPRQRTPYWRSGISPSPEATLPPPPPPQQQQQQQQASISPPPPPGLSPPVVLDFVQYLSRLIAAQYELPHERLHAVHLCMSRLLLDVLHPLIWPAFVERYASRDAMFTANQRRLRAMHPSQLGVEPRFWGGADGDERSDVELSAQPPPLAPPPPLAAASVLGEVCMLASPVDQLLCLYRAVGLVHRHAGDVSGVEGSAIGADSLMPLLVWTVCHTPMPHAFAALEYCRELSSKEQQTASELGYYLACLEGACLYILDASCELPKRDEGGERGEHDAAEGGRAAAEQPPEEASATRLATDGGGAAEEAGRLALASFLQQERAVDELVGALCL